MRFQLAHKLVTYLLVLAAVAALAATRALSSSTAVLFLAACAASFAVDPGNRLAAALDRATLGLRIAALLLFAALLWRIWRHLPDPDYGPGFDLGLALLGYKLFYRRTHRDYIHILAFSFLLVLVASTLAASFAFVVAFAVYVTFAVWGLILFHLRREMEENYLVKHSAQAPSQKVGVGRILGSRRVVGGSFFLATGAVALAVLAGAVAIFMLVPRMGAGFVLGGAPGTGGLVAPGDEIALGRYGTQAAARRDVVLRATIPAIAALGGDEVRRRAADGLYFRGATYDVYEHGRWAHSHKPEVATLVGEDDGPRARRYWVSEPGEGDAAGARLVGGSGAPGLAGGTAAPGVVADEAALDADVRQEIEAVGLPAGVLFAIDRAVALELPAPRLGAAGALRVAPRWSGEAALRVGGAGGEGFLSLAQAHYIAYSSARLVAGTPGSGAPVAFPRPPPPSTDPSGPSPSATHAIADWESRPVLSPGARSVYVALPPVAEQRLGALAQNISAGWIETNTGEPGKITTVIDWLRAGHRYASRPPAVPAGGDPVQDFIFNQTEGHCELFASAAVLMLRAAGVPARYVTGFRGGEWNAVGGYVAVRADRAHAWAEAFLPETGWVRVDATPPGPSPPPAGRLAEMLDAFDYYWSRWVVGYDLPRQRDLAVRAGRRLAPLGSSWTLRHPLAAAGWLSLAIATAALALTGARAWRRRQGGAGAGLFARRLGAGHRPAAGGAAIERLYRRTAKRLGRAGWPRYASETPREYARRVRHEGVYPGGDFDLLTERYAAARFGEHAVDDAFVADLAAKLASGAPTAGHPVSRAPDARA
jgi:transglutaminase-like putative cysteine protease